MIYGYQNRSKTEVKPIQNRCVDQTRTDAELLHLKIRTHLHTKIHIN